MQINTMISQLSGGMLVSTEIFVVTLVFSLPLGLLLLAECRRIRSCREL